jgi:hypothetical protein
MDIKSILNNDIEQYNSKYNIRRKKFNKVQLKFLNEIFNESIYPSTKKRYEIANLFKRSPRCIQIWFQNKRQYIKKHKNKYRNN